MPDAINFAKEHGVVILIIPPHCNNKQQPLDKTVYKPLKGAYNRAMDSWVFAHLGNTVSIYGVSEIFKEAFVEAMTPKNIINGFKSCGIFPFNCNIFFPNEFLTSFVSDRPESTTPTPVTPMIVDVLSSTSSITPDSNRSTEISPSFLPEEPTAVIASSSKFISAANVLGLPKAGKGKKSSDDKGEKKQVSSLALLK